jgi:hypothetical protein
MHPHGRSSVAFTTARAGNNDIHTQKFRVQNGDTAHYTRVGQLESLRIRLSHTTGTPVRMALALTTSRTVRIGSPISNLGHSQ